MTPSDEPSLASLGAIAGEDASPPEPVETPAARPPDRDSGPTAASHLQGALPAFLVLGLGLFVAYVTVLVLSDGGVWGQRASDLSFVVFPLLAAWGPWRAARAGGPHRRTWLLLAVAMGAWSVGGAIWCSYTFTGSPVPFPSLADLFFVGYALPAVAGLLLLDTHRTRVSSRLRIALDSVVIALSLVLVVWSKVLSPLLDQGGSVDGRQQAVALAYPVGDLLLLSVLAAVLMRVRSRDLSDLGAWLALLAGLALLAVTDIVYVHRLASGAYMTGTSFDLLWASSFLLVAASPHLGALAGVGGSRSSVGQALLPYAALVAAAVSVLSLPFAPLSEPALVPVAVLLLAGASSRQVLVVCDKVRQECGLERRVEEANGRLQQERELLSAVAEHVDAGIVACGADGRLSYYNAAAARMHADPEGGRTDQWWRDLFAGDGASALQVAELPLTLALRRRTVESQEMVIAPAQGPAVAVATSGRALHDEQGRVTGAVLVMHDVTEDRRQRQVLQRRALQDELSGLGNRDAFELSLAAMLADHAPVAVLLLDLDDFKHVNDSLGHTAGDECLSQTGRRLQEAAPPGSVACRLGGDEFVLLLPRADRTAAADAADVLLSALHERMVVAGSDLRLSGSIGVALSGPGYLTVTELLKAADLAMYLAKDRGKGQYALYEERLRQGAIQRLALHSDLRTALADESLHLAYQPIVELSSGRMTGVEALVRWQHAEHGAVSPVDFIPVAEETGLILPLGSWVLRHACQQLLTWDADVPSDLRMSVNVSTRQLERPGLLEVLDECLATGIAPWRLCLEVTETALAYDSAATLDTLHAVRARGVHLAVDDFGTGYSSLARLRSAPVSRLKVDRSFIAEIDTRDADVPIVDATMAMSRGLGLGVIAEGIETAEQLAYLSDAGCPEAQGFLLSRPVDPATVLRFLRGDVPWTQHTSEHVDLAARRATATLDDLVARSVDSHVDLAAFGPPLLAAVVEATGMDTAWVGRVEGTEQRLVLVHPSGDERLRGGELLPWSGSAAEAVLGAERRSDCLAQDVPHVAGDTGAASMLVEPVHLPGGGVYGVLCAQSDRTRLLSETDSATMRMFARLLEQKLALGAAPAGVAVPEPAPRGRTRDGDRARALARWTALLAERRDGSADGLVGGVVALDWEQVERARSAHEHVLDACSEERPAGSTTVVIADDLKLLREVLALHIATIGRLCLVGEAGSAADTLGIVIAEQPDVLVLDHELGDAVSSVIMDDLRLLSPRTRVLLHSGRQDLHALGQRMGVDRVVHKAEDPERLAEALTDLVD